MKLPYSRIPIGKCRRNNLSRKYIVSGGHQWILNLVGKYGGEHVIYSLNYLSTEYLKRNSVYSGGTC